MFPLQQPVISVLLPRASVHSCAALTVLTVLSLVLRGNRSLVCFD